jgi:hypothetical protein
VKQGGVVRGIVLTEKMEKSRSKLVGGHEIRSVNSNQENSGNVGAGETHEIVERRDILMVNHRWMTVDLWERTGQSNVMFIMRVSEDSK